MADAPYPVTSPPSQPGQPYDAAADGSVSGWDKAPDDFPDGPGPWRQC
jgi:hypothetical protein